VIVDLRGLSFEERWKFITSLILELPKLKLIGHLEAQKYYEALSEEDKKKLGTFAFDEDDEDLDEFIFKPFVKSLALPERGYG
jgi:hypothetical protein